MHYLLKQFIPSIASNLRWFSFKYGWKGNYASFEEANKIATGYNAEPILERIKATTHKVVNKEIAYERDGIAYDKPIMNFNMLSALLWIASQKNNSLTVLDFGGSLGTTYHHTAPFLSHLNKLNWCIVEQPNYVDAGKKEFETDQLHFYYSIKECLQYHQPDVIIFCGVIQYIEKTYELLEEVKNTQIPYLLLDFMAYNDDAYDRICIQHVPPVFYGVDASYTCWFYDKTKQFNWLNQYYNMVFDFISEPNKYYIHLKPFLYEGQLWKLK
jgi:putative methyltransferase (TIGR04325 family)